MKKKLNPHRQIPIEMQACKICSHYVDNPFRPNPKCDYHNHPVTPFYQCTDFDLSSKVDRNTIEMAKEIIDAYIYLRENNHSIPDVTLDFMKQASLQKLKDMI